MTFSDSNKLAISNSEDPRKIDCTSKHFVENSDIPFLLCHCYTKTSLL